MRPKYLLDTNVIFKFPTPELKELSEELDICISPHTVFELFRRLDDETFKRQKGRVLKCQIPKILKNPFYQLNERFGLYESKEIVVAMPDEIFSKMFPLLGKSKSLDEFYSHTFRTNDGQIRETQDSAKLAKQEIQEEKERFRRHINEIAEKIDESDVEIRWPDQVLSVAETWWERNKGNKPSESQRLGLFKSIYCSQYYIYETVLRYMKKSEENNTEIDVHLDLNDAIDWMIVTLLDLDRNLILVTEDENVERIIKNGFWELKTSNYSDLQIKANVQSLDALTKPGGIHESI